LCGIAGIRKLGDKPITERMIRLFLTGLEHRGNDASGIALQNPDGYVRMIKMGSPAWTFVSSDEYTEFLDETLKADPIAVILHTRAATKGNPHIAKNNHPLFLDKSMVVHNGMIHNDDEKFKQWDMPRSADTDSDIIRAAVDKWGITPKVIEQLDTLRGTAAIAAIHPSFPGKMLLGRSGSPLSIAANDDFFCFASEKNIIHRAMRPWKDKGNWGMYQQQVSDFGFSPFPDNTLWILGEEGLEHHGKLSTCMGTYREPIRRVYQNYRPRHEDWKRNLTSDKFKEQFNADREREKGRVINIVRPSDNSINKLNINCPSCNKALVLRLEQQHMDFADLSCPIEHGGCGKRLAERKVN
jgi:asparagine synthetase B (glutamine-hydrolysing)